MLFYFGKKGKREISKSLRIFSDFMDYFPVPLEFVRPALYHCNIIDRKDEAR